MDVGFLHDTDNIVVLSKGLPSIDRMRLGNGRSVYRILGYGIVAVLYESAVGTGRLPMGVHQNGMGVMHAQKGDDACGGGGL